MNDVTIIRVGLHPFGRFDGKADGATEITGALPVNTDGGLIANGEWIGAWWLRQCTSWCVNCAARQVVVRLPCWAAGRCRAQTNDVLGDHVAEHLERAVVDATNGVNR